MLIVIAILHNLDIHQMNVKTRFLNDNLNEEIYMEQPEGFIVKGQEYKVCNVDTRKRQDSRIHLQPV